MHTHHGTGVNFHHNADFSGDIVIELTGRTIGMDRITIPAKELLEFVAFAYVARRRVEAVEGMEAGELLK